MEFENAHYLESSPYEGQIYAMRNLNRAQIMFPYQDYFVNLTNYDLDITSQVKFEDVG